MIGFGQNLKLLKVNKFSKNKKMLFNIKRFVDQSTLNKSLAGYNLI